MIIHTVRRGETIDSIAHRYGIPPSIVKNLNELPKSGTPVEGQELLILTPTRSYTVKRGDSTDEITAKFKITEKELLTNNPCLKSSAEPKPGDSLAIRYQHAAKGIAASNGYFYNGCDLERLTEVIPYLTYLTVASALRDKRGITVLFDDKPIVDTSKAFGVVPLLRVYDTTFTPSSETADDWVNFIDSMIALAKSRGYRGIVFAAYQAYEKNTGELLEFIVELRKRLIENDMLLFTEFDEKSPVKLVDLSDGGIMTYDKMDLGKIPNFKNGEAAVISMLAEKSESSNIFIDLPSLALSGGRYFGYRDAIELASENGAVIMSDDDAMICYFTYTDSNGQKKTVKLPSLKNTEAKLNLINELGFLGVSFDIKRVPSSYLAAFNSVFKIAPYSFI